MSRRQVEVAFVSLHVPTDIMHPMVFVVFITPQHHCFFTLTLDLFFCKFAFVTLTCRSFAFTDLPTS
jgi:hypothetical protein